MELWTVFLTGLLAGGASCAAVQGGLLTGLLARREPSASAATYPPAGTPRSGTISGADAVRARSGTAVRERPMASATRVPAARRPRQWHDDAAPVTAFLVGKLVSHALLGLLLGLVGDAVQLGFRTRALSQGFAGVVMILMALHLLGVRRLGFLVPQPPARLGRLVRHSARSQAMAAPAVLGLLTVFIPCGVTLGVAFLAIASGSPLGGALIMTVFVLGTVPLFGALGYAAARWAVALGGRIATATAVVVLLVGLYTLNGGLALGGAPVSASSIAGALNSVSAATSGSVAAPSDGFIGPRLPGQQAPALTSGPQDVEIEVFDTDYRAPKAVQAGRPTTVTLVTDGTRGCTRGFVVPSLGIEQILPETGRTVVDVGVLQAGRLEFTCSMGMYGGSFDVVA